MRGPAVNDLLERPVLPAPFDLTLPPHEHTERCWWHPERAGWVCPPSDGTT
jgi:hypothetical protein